MKVLMLGRLDLFKGGGDKVQVENTAMELRKLGVEADIKADLNVNVLPYDLVHVFQLDWTSENYFYALKAREAKKPLILSPIHHNIDEVKKFDDKFVFDFRRISKILFKDQFHRDVYKNVYRALSDRRKIGPLIKSIMMGLKNMHIQTLKMSDVVLVQTELEAVDLKKTYGVDINWKLVKNGVGSQFTHKTKDAVCHVASEDYLLCVGRIEPRKNQLSIIKAVEKLRQEEEKDFKLVLIGVSTFMNHPEYNLRFKEALKKNPWITYIEGVPYKDIASYYQFAKVGISASWFETTGLTSLEALFCGTNAVASGNRAHEYLGDWVSYCKPDDVDSIKKAIKKEYYCERPTITEKMKHEYTWEKAALDTLKVYKDLL